MPSQIVLQRRRLLEVGVALSAGLGTASRAWAQMPQIIQPDGQVSTGSSYALSSASAQRSSDGHFYFNAAVNGAQLHFLLDTGASIVAIRAEDAEKIGFDVDRLDYSLTMQTANGSTRAAPIVLNTVTVGAITLHNVRATVGAPGRLNANLLGQSFTARLPSIKIENDMMVLQGG